MSGGKTELVRTDGEGIVGGDGSPASRGRLQAGHDDNVDDQGEQQVHLDLMETRFVEDPTKGEQTDEPDDSVARDLQQGGKVRITGAE